MLFDRSSGDFVSGTVRGDGMREQNRHWHNNPISEWCRRRRRKRLPWPQMRPLRKRQLPTIIEHLIFTMHKKAENHLTLHITSCRPCTRRSQKKVLFRGRTSPRFGFNSCCSLNSLRERFNHMIGLNLVLSPVPLSPLLVDAKFNPNFDTRDTNPLCYFISLTFSTLLNLDEDDEESKTKFFLPVRCSRKPRGDCSRSSLPRASWLAYKRENLL